ncbi:MAG: class I SAM-dependent RNA methyltransferase [Flavobacteriales bacterium]|nr:class I SAM-dependent RNA methyltransferase [Flavobacteriales bacterium]
MSERPSRKPDPEFDMMAQTMYGLEPVLVEELLRLGAKDVSKHNRAVSFRGDLGFLYKANLCLRTALRVLVPVDDFPVQNEQDIYAGIKKIPWEVFMGVDDTFAFTAKLNTEHFGHSQYVALLAKDAVADRFREKTGKRPSVDAEDPMLRIRLFISGDRCSVALDSSGDSLHKRGYREQTNLAPLNEVLAAGMIMLSGWDRMSNFVDPMCGSGTLLIEAALLAANIPPGAYRKGFAFQRWNDFDAALWEKIHAGAMERISGNKPVILGGELSKNVARKAETNIAIADLKDEIEVKNVAFEDLPAPEGRGVLIINPPYGERMDEDEDINGLYKMIGDTLKKNWSGYDAWVLTPNMEAAKYIKLTPRPKIRLYNGALDCRFLRYELYAGSRRREQAE